MASRNRWKHFMMMGVVLAGTVLACSLPSGDSIDVACDVAALIDALNSANANADHTTINLDTDCDYLLDAVDNLIDRDGNPTGTDGANGLPVISTPITINGNNALIRRFGSAPDEFRLFYIASTGSLTLNDIDLENGLVVSIIPATLSRNGGAIYNNGGTLTINDSKVLASESTDFGAGIYNRNGNVTINNSWVSFNETHNYGGGIGSMGGSIIIEGNSLLEGNSATQGAAAIYLADGATLTVNDTTFLDNSSGLWGGAIGSRDAMITLNNVIFEDNTANGDGGAIKTFSDSSYTITNCQFLNNRAAEVGGAIDYAGVKMDIVDSVFDGNIAQNRYGGAISNSGTMTIQNSTIENNQADTLGGGGIHNASSLTIEGTTISNNNAVSDNGGGITNRGDLSITTSTIENNYAEKSGGGIRNTGELTITYSTIANNVGNETGGGISHGDTSLVIFNSTISGNRTNMLSGSAIIAVENLEISYTTITNNVSGDVDVGPALMTALDGISITNSIIANNLGGNCSYPATTPISGSNLDSDGTCKGFTITADPLLGPLAANGGPTFTHALTAGSPAIDAATGTCLPDDQRGVSRPGGSACDLGAYESDFTAEEAPPTSTEVTVTIEDSACTFTAAVNLFCRAGPASSIYPEIDTFVPGQMAQGIGRSADGAFLYVTGPNYGKVCTVPLDSKFGETTGDCDRLPIFTPPPPPPTPTDTPTIPPPTPTETPTVPRPSNNDSQNSPDVTETPGQSNQEN